MASTREYLEYVLEQIAALEDISYRPMMGEYVIRYQGKTVGGIYDDRFLLKATKGAQQLLKDSSAEMQLALPYPGAKEMLAADVDDRQLCCRLIETIAEELPEPKKR